MSKRLWSVLAAAALVASVFSALPAKAAVTVPEEPNIVDPVGDANYVHDGHDSRLPIGRNHTSPAGSINATGDLAGVWFSNDQDNISVHVQTAVPPRSGWGLSFHVYASPGEGSAGSSSVGCLRFSTILPGSNAGGGTYQGQPIVNLHDRCNVGGNFFSASTPGEYEIVDLDDGTGVLTSTWPRSASPLLGDGSILTEPYATAATYTTGAEGIGFIAVPIDNTDRGVEYAISSGDDVVSEPPVMEEPPKVDEPKKQNCKKIKNKKKRQQCIKRNKKLAKPQGCADYAPGELGAEAETVVVKDEATEEAPVELEFDFGNGIPENPNQEHQQVNVQVDPKASEAGLYVRFEFANYEDMDLWAYHASGDEAARAAGYNPAPVSVFDGTGNGGHSEQGAEQLDGIRTSKCGGYTIDMATFQNMSGTKTLKLWLGEVVNDPK